MPQHHVLVLLYITINIFSCYLIIVGGTTSLLPNDKIISGTSPWKYQYIPLQLPLHVKDNIQNGHGLTKDLNGNIYFTYQPINISDSTQVLVKFYYDSAKKSMVATALGSTDLSQGVPHGLQYEFDDDDATTAKEEYLYHANNQQTIFKTDLLGNIIWKSNFSDWVDTKPNFWPFKPTDCIVIPKTDILLVADGYGSSFVHSINKTTGEYIEGKSFGGKGNTTSDPIRFNTPHGIKIDVEKELIIISDRSNNRIVWVDYDFKYVRSKTLHEGLALPCNEHLHYEKSTDEYVSIVPSLGDSYQQMYNGSVGIYNQRGDGELLSVIEVAKLLGKEGHQHPHDAIFLENGDAIICCWSGPADYGPAKGTVSYWKKL